MAWLAGRRRPALRDEPTASPARRAGGRPWAASWRPALGDERKASRFLAFTTLAAAITRHEKLRKLTIKDKL